MKRIATVVVAAGLIVALAACGGETFKPDVVGMTLPDAKVALSSANYTASVHAKDALFGVLVEDNFVVCSVDKLNEHSVRLEVAKHGC